MKPQLPDSLCLWRLADELNAAVAGGVIRRVVTVAARTAVLEISARGRRRGLLIAWQPGLARAHMVREAQPFGADPFVAALGRRVEGARIVEVRQQAFDRVLVLELANIGQLGPEERGLLIVEATGRQANCVLVDVNGTIVAVARPTPRREDIYRTLAPGELYCPPPGQDKLDPREMTAEDLSWPGHCESASLLKCLRLRFQGISRLLAAELAYRAGLDLDAPVSQQPEDFPGRLAGAMSSLVAECLEGKAWLYQSADGTPLAAYPTRLAHAEAAGARAEPADSLSEAVEEIATHLAFKQRIETLRGRVLQSLRRQIERKRRLVETRRAELAEARHADQWRRWAELLLANLHAVADAWPGQMVKVVDYYSPDQPSVEIPLLPDKGPKETAEAYFRRHRRAKRAVKRLPELIQRAEAELRHLEALRQRAANTNSLEELEGIAAETASRETARAEEEDHRSGIVGRAVAPSGHVVLFGRSAAGNDEIARMARPDDLWLHARGVKGAHVLIRVAPGEDVPRETLLFAARIAGRLSDYRRDGVADVDYTRARYVRKPRGSKPGFVTYTHQKTITVSLGDRQMEAE